MYSLTPYPITPIGNFIGFVLALLPLFSNIRKLSVAVWAYAIWIAVYNFVGFVNTIIWHNNVNVVVPVWCDIGTKLQIGTTMGTRACTFVICIRLYNITRMHGSIESTKSQKRRTMIYELSLVIGLPFLIMGLWIIIQPIRFQIYEEEGCIATDWSYVTYIIQFGPQVLVSIGCLILAPLTLRAFFRHQKEMDEFLSSGGDITYNKYYRLMVIACLDILFNLPILIIDIVTSIVSGSASSLNYPYISWSNIHDGFDSILQVPANDWSTDTWITFYVKWDEWLYVLHALIFFCVFGTTPEMRSYYRTVFWFIPERLGLKKRCAVSEVETVSDAAFNSNPGRLGGDSPAAKKRRGSLSFLETTVDSASGAHSGATASGLDAMTSHLGIETITVQEGEENQEGTVAE